MNLRTIVIMAATAGLSLTLCVGCASASYKGDMAPSQGAYSGADRAAEAETAAAPPPMAPGGGGGGYNYADSYTAADDAPASSAPVAQPAPRARSGSARKIAAPPKDTRAGGEKAGGTEEPPASQEPAAKRTKRIIIYVADVGIVVLEPGEVREKIAALITELGGWVQQSSSNAMNLRVPADQFELAITEIQALGEVSYKNITGTDVTEEFFDLGVRLKNAEAIRDRYVELLAKAKDVKDSLLIERELGRITGEIEKLKGRLKFLRQHAAYSTIRLNLQKKTVNTPPKVTRVPLPFYWLQSYRLENVLY